MQRHTKATASDFSRNKISSVEEIHEKQMSRILSSFTICQVPSCRILVKREGDLLCVEHIHDFVNELATRI